YMARALATEHEQAVCTVRSSLLDPGLVAYHVLVSLHHDITQAPLGGRGPSATAMNGLSQFDQPRGMLVGESPAVAEDAPVIAKSGDQGTCQADVHRVLSEGNGDPACKLGV